MGGAVTKAAGSAASKLASATASTLKAIDDQLETSAESTFQKKVVETSSKKLRVLEENNLASQMTDLSFVQKGNEKALEREMASMFMDIAGPGGALERQREKVMKLNGETLAVDSRNPWVGTWFAAQSLRMCFCLIEHER